MCVHKKIIFTFCFTQRQSLLNTLAVAPTYQQRVLEN
jgi:hypothetical protein